MLQPGSQREKADAYSFLGDVVGRVARQQVIAAMPDLREELAADFIIVNVENSAGGFGVTPDIADAFLAAGADVLTTGNHVWDKREIIAYIDTQPRLLRPYNMIENTPGKGVVSSAMLQASGLLLPI